MIGLSRYQWAVLLAAWLDRTMGAISPVALVPLAGLLPVPLVIETRGRSLVDWPAFPPEPELFSDSVVYGLAGRMGFL